MPSKSEDWYSNKRGGVHWSMISSTLVPSRSRFRSIIAAYGPPPALAPCLHSSHRGRMVCFAIKPHCINNLINHSMFYYIAASSLPFLSPLFSENRIGRQVPIIFSCKDSKRYEELKTLHTTSKTAYFTALALFNKLP